MVSCECNRKETVYFREAGAKNTDLLLKIVKNYVEKEEINDIVVASTTGETGVKAAKILKPRNVVVVTHHFGFREPGKIELLEENKREILTNGAKVFTGTHTLGSVEHVYEKVSNLNSFP